MNRRKILVLTTGGTIEKSYSEEDGSIKNNESIFKEKLLRRLRLPHTSVEVIQIMAKDSLDMTDQDRELIVESIKSHSSNFDGIVVLHGTDTLTRSLTACYESINNPRIAVVFTGAMRPAGFEDSDAQQNFTEALYAAQMARPGFYVSFHGKLFVAPKVAKDKNLKTFISVD